MHRLGVLIAGDSDKVGPCLAGIGFDPADQRLQVLGLCIDRQDALLRIEPCV